MKLDEHARYSQTHEWVRKEGDLFVYGITDHAQESLSDIVYVELPEVGAVFARGDRVGAVESVKAASDLNLSMGGTVVEINEALSGAPELLNRDPYGQGWMLKFRAADPGEWDQLLSGEAYQKLVGE